MTQPTQTTTSPLALPLGLCSPMWPAYGLFMGASLQWWAISRLARFASPVWAFEPKSARETEAPVETVAAPVPVDAVAEPAVEPVAEAPVAFTAAPEPEVAPPLEAAPEPELLAAPVEPYVEPAPAAPEPKLVASPEPETPAAPVVSPAPGEVDDLTLIRGIGPRVADALVARGVLTFRQLAHWSEKDMHHFDTELKLLGRSKRYDFLGQAKALASEA